MNRSDKEKYKNWGIGAVGGILIASLFPAVLNVVDNFRGQVGI